MTTDLETLLVPEYVSRDEAIKWCENALRNVNNLTLSWDDIADIAESLTRFRVASLATLAEHAKKLEAALREADKALRQHACHGGPNAPCLRPDWQCREECGQLAGDVLLIVEAVLTQKEADRAE